MSGVGLRIVYESEIGKGKDSGEITDGGAVSIINGEGVIVRRLPPHKKPSHKSRDRAKKCLVAEGRHFRPSERHTSDGGRTAHDLKGLEGDARRLGLRRGLAKHILDHVKDCDTLVVDIEMYEAVRRNISYLDESDRRIMELHLQGASARETAELLHVPKSTVHDRIKRSRAALKGALATEPVVQSWLYADVAA